MERSIDVPEGYEIVWKRPFFEGEPKTMRDELDRGDKVSRAINELVELSPDYEGQMTYGKGMFANGRLSEGEGIFRGIIKGECGVYFCVGINSFLLGSVRVFARKKKEGYLHIPQKIEGLVSGIASV